MVNISKYARELAIGSYRLMQKADNSMGAGAEVVLRELKMVPKYLELATLNGKERFNTKETEELISAFRDNIGGMPKSNLVKGLLEIGTEKGVPLSVKEMKAFLAATTELESEEQENVLKFVKYIKEKDYPKYDKDFILKNHTFENFLKTHGKYKWLSQEKPEMQKKVYHNMLAKELDSIKYQSTRDVFEIKHQNADYYVSTNNMDFVREGIAKCDSPEILAEIVSQTGITPAATYASNAIVDAYKISNGDIGLMHDLTKCFYPSEVKEISSKLTADKVKDYLPESVMQQYEHFTPEKISLNKARKTILKNLDLDGQIKMLPLIRRRYEDVFRCGVKITGNFEGGKRR